MAYENTPFHASELAIQERLGVAEMVHTYAPRFVRSFMPEEHRAFFSELSYFFVASLDEVGQPWGSILIGDEGFIASPTPETLEVKAALPKGDPLTENLKTGAELGMVGLAFHSRRRNRVNGRVTARTDGSFSVAVTQSFGNCPQYIQARTASIEGTAAAPAHAAKPRNNLSGADRLLIEAADTLFIASVSQNPGTDASRGADMSHRGGEPGFVKVLEDGSILIPDFKGNNHFNTLGNIADSGTAGLLFIDFEKGGLLQLTGSAEILWPEDSPYDYDGAQRYIRLSPKVVLSRPEALPVRWVFHEASPYSPQNASWRKRESGGLKAFTLVDKQVEAEGVASFLLAPSDHSGTHPYQPGQHLPLEVEVNGKRYRRTYTLSSAPRPNILRITVKREAGGIVSRHLHDNLSPGDVIFARPPAGRFTLIHAPKRPAVFLSAGIGITPMMAMAEALLITTPTRPALFIHGAKNDRTIPFLPQITDWQRRHPTFQTRFAFSQASDPASRSRIDADLLDRMNLPQNADFYLCGPAAFMQDISSWLRKKGVHEASIHSETFGPSSLPTPTPPQQEYAPVSVVFEKSGTTTVWDPNTESLLESAEKAGIDAPFSCRNGSCGSCAVKLLKGTLSHPGASIGPVEGETLTCSARPTDNSNTSIAVDL